MCTQEEVQDGLDGGELSTQMRGKVQKGCRVNIRVRTPRRIANNSEVSLVPK